MTRLPSIANRTRRLWRACAAWLLTPVFLFAPVNPALARLYAGNQSGESPHGMVAAAHPLAVLAGVEMLRRGGNAFDAAVAAGFVLSVVEPHSSGLGGGGFALTRHAPDGAVRFLDFRERAPAAAHSTMFLRDGKPVPNASLDGGLSVAVPGTVAGLLWLHEKYGALPRTAVLEPAIRHAREGFPLFPLLRDRIIARAACLSRYPAAAEIFLRGGKAPSLKTPIVQADLARTIERIGAGGAKAFYESELANAMAGAVQADGGILTAADLKSYTPIERKPIRFRAFDREIISAPPPSSGGIILAQVLGVLEHRLGRDTPTGKSADHLHLLIEALRRSYADRSHWIGDPEYFQTPVRKLTRKELIRARAESIGESASPSSQVRPEYTGEGGAGAEKSEPAVVPMGKNTTHFSIVDAKGNAVSITQSINYSFGSCLIAPGTGVLLNDTMDDFAAAENVLNAYGLPGGTANRIDAGKTPVSSMSPTIVLDAAGQVETVVGAPGGSTIPTTVIQVLLNRYYYRMGAMEAIAAPRIHHQWMPDMVLAEPFALGVETMNNLRTRGHSLKTMEHWGNAHLITRETADGPWIGASDPRGEGAAEGP
ncbi:MAG: Glutathione hydrolase proenzyme [Myxococcota bacterium]|nr:Glutathione hydrolase proenzyme [Myxococcota bacterium]